MNLKNSRIYSCQPTYDVRFYNIEAQISDCVLLKEEDRKFVIPRANGENFEFGQSNFL